MNFKQALDCISKAKLVEDLARGNIHQKFERLICVTLKWTTVYVRIQQESKDRFATNQGVRQKEAPSTALLNLVLGYVMPQIDTDDTIRNRGDQICSRVRRWYCNNRKKAWNYGRNVDGNSNRRKRRRNEKVAPKLLWKNMWIFSMLFVKRSVFDNSSSASTVCWSTCSNWVRVFMKEFKHAISIYYIDFVLMVTCFIKYINYRNY